MYLCVQRGESGGVHANVVDIVGGAVGAGRGRAGSRVGRWVGRRMGGAGAGGCHSCKPYTCAVRLEGCEARRHPQPHCSGGGYCEARPAECACTGGDPAPHPTPPAAHPLPHLQRWRTTRPGPLSALWR